MTYAGSLFDLSATMSKKRVNMERPSTFEELKQDNGFVLYQRLIEKQLSLPSVLSIVEPRDRAYVFVNRRLAGILGRGEDATQLPIMALKGDLLEIVVENQGRINHGPLMIGDFKGLVGEVKVNGKALKGGWNSTAVNIEEYHLLANGIYDVSEARDEMGFWVGSFKTDCQENGFDTFLSLPNWWKGVAFINGFNLGRFWPSLGPQQTLFVPSTAIKGSCQENHVVLFEQERPGCKGRGHQQCQVEFVAQPRIDGPTPSL